jgi:hypothetical protein
MKGLSVQGFRFVRSGAQWVQLAGQLWFSAAAEIDLGPVVRE